MAEVATARTQARSGDVELVTLLFTRGLGAVFAIAFVSLAVQVIGLIGERGIMPAAELLQRFASDPDSFRELYLPTWLRFTGASDAALRGACLLGSACSIALALGLAPRALSFASWSLYLSLCAVGNVFFSYQWDALLLECGLTGMLVAGTRSPLGIWLARALCLKLMLLSGIVKLTSGDPTWRDLSAMSYHFWTQPLPAWPAVPIAALPAGVLAALTFATLAVELCAPLAVAFGRRARLAVAAALAGLQLGIAATGNYGFFNLLSLLLCATLLDDAALLALCPRRLRPYLERARARSSERLERASEARRARAGRAVHRVLAIGLLGLSIAAGLERVLPTRLPLPVEMALELVAPLRSVNSYGLFAVMTTQRHEIALEGSQDGEHWQRYTFAWKPDRLDARPRFLAPHMPRLDWQMWFAALGRCEQQRWLHRFVVRILEGSADVLELLEAQPFPDGPPRFIRTPQAAYRFTGDGDWLRGRWWTSEPLPDYCPVLTLQNGRLAVVATSR